MNLEDADICDPQIKYQRNKENTLVDIQTHLDNEPNLVLYSAQVSSLPQTAQPE